MEVIKETISPELMEFLEKENVDDILKEEQELMVPYHEVKLGEKTHIYNDHALISAKISILRDKETPSSQFRTIIEEITMLLCSDAFSHLTLEDCIVETPICRTIGKRIAGKKLVLLPILRAGNGMEPAIKKIIPQSRTGMCGLSRDEETLVPSKYLWKIPKDIENREVFILDPMLATGGSINFTIRKLMSIGCKPSNIHVMCIVAAPQGVDLIQTNHPEVEMFIAHLDKGLNDKGYIVPGLGDAGDRIFGTK